MIRTEENIWRGIEGQNLKQGVNVTCTLLHQSYSLHWWWTHITSSASEKNWQTSVFWNGAHLSVARQDLHLPHIHLRTKDMRIIYSGFCSLCVCCVLLSIVNSVFCWFVWNFCCAVRVPSPRTIRHFCPQSWTCLHSSKTVLVTDGNTRAKTKGNVRR